MTASYAGHTQWQIAEATERGKPSDPEKMRKYPVIFDGDQMEMIYEGNKTIKWTVTLHPDKKPAEIDATLPRMSRRAKSSGGFTSSMRAR